MAGTIPVLFVRSFSVLGRSGVERVGTVWLTGDIFGIISHEQNHKRKKQRLVVGQRQVAAQLAQCLNVVMDRVPVISSR